MGEGPLVRQGRPVRGRVDLRHHPARVLRRVAARGHGGRPGRAGHLRPAEPHLPLRRLHRRRGRGPRDRARRRAALHRGRRLRRAHQPDDRRRPDPRRPGRGRRDRADGGHHVRRRGQLPQRVVHGLPDPDGARVPGLRAGRDGHAVPAPPARGQGRGGVPERGLAAGDRQRRSSTRCSRSAWTTSTCRARPPACGRRCRGTRPRPSERAARTMSRRWRGACPPSTTSSTRGWRRRCSSRSASRSRCCWRGRRG